MCTSISLLDRVLVPEHLFSLLPSAGDNAAELWLWLDQGHLTGSWGPEAGDCLCMPSGSCVYSCFPCHLPSPSKSLLFNVSAAPRSKWSQPHEAASRLFCLKFPPALSCCFFSTCIQHHSWLCPCRSSFIAPCPTSMPIPAMLPAAWPTPCSICPLLREGTLKDGTLGSSCSWLPQRSCLLSSQPCYPSQKLIPGQVISACMCASLFCLNSDISWHPSCSCMSKLLPQ